MKLHEKIYQLRKQAGMSQEETAERLSISRQALSRWENGTAQPAANNIVEICKLFGVTSVYLLNDEYKSDDDLPKVKEIRTNGIYQIIICLITLEVMVLILQLVTTFILQNVFFAALSFIPFVAVVGGFEYAYQKNVNVKNERTARFRKLFFKISVWLGAYFPIRFLIMALMNLYPRPINMLVLECVIVAVYLMSAVILNLLIDRCNLPKQ